MVNSGRLGFRLCIEDVVRIDEDFTAAISTVAFQQWQGAILDG